MEPTDLIWMNGDFVAWEDAKVHVLTHGLHYGTGVFDSMRCYDTELGPAVFRNAEHIDRLLRSAELYYMPVPYSAEELRAATLELVARNGLRSCYIRPIVNRGYGQMGLNPLEAPVDVTIACWEWGAYLGEEGMRNGVRAKVVLVAADQPRLADPAREGLRAVPQQRARQGRVAEGRLRRGDPARRPRPRVRGHRRERVHRARRRDRHARPAQLDPRRHHAPLDHPDRARPRLHGGRAQRRARRDVPRRRGVHVRARPPSSCPVREVDDHAIGTGKPGEITRVLQTAFDDAIHGRSERYREWLDVVRPPALETPTGEAAAPSATTAAG